MTIPRSVREMSKLDFLPKHCESDNFRGFSFIGESFPLPERTVSYPVMDSSTRFFTQFAHKIALLSQPLRLLSKNITGIMRKMTGKVYQSVHPVYSTMIWAIFLPPSQFQRRRSALRARRRINSNLSHHLRQRTRMKQMKMQLQIRKRVQMANMTRRKKQRRIKRIFSLLMESQMLFLISKPLIPLPGRNHSIQMPKHGV